MPLLPLVVSLFTREWIEIFLSLRRPAYPPSPSLRGSGLKLFLLYPQNQKRPVSLFTREWIEMEIFTISSNAFWVSLFTREWIEIEKLSFMEVKPTSPSLRGSGLKLQCSQRLRLSPPSPSLRGSGLKSNRWTG